MTVVTLRSQFGLRCSGLSTFVCELKLMSETVFTGIRDLLHITLHLWDLSGSGGCAKCPDCVCATCEPIVQEKVPEALTIALTFAQQQCSGTTSTTTTLNSSCWPFSLFWIGVTVGAVVASVLLVTFAFCLRCCRDSTSQPARSPPVCGISRQLSLADGEPANPRTLRQAGLLR